MTNISTPQSPCRESGGPCSGGSNNNRPREEVTYVYKEKDGKCVREQVTTRLEDPDACTCVANESCPTESVVTTQTTGGGVHVNTNRVNVDVNTGGVNVVVRRGRRQVGEFFDAIFGPPSAHSRSGNLHYGSIFDFLPKVDVAVNRPGFFGDRRVNVNIGNGHGIRVGVNRNSNPFFTFGMGPPNTYDDRNDNRNAGPDGTCLNCGGPAPSVRPTRRRVSVTPSPTPRCSSGQVSQFSISSLHACIIYFCRLFPVSARLR